MMNRWSRKLHRWGSILIALPLLLVIITGLILQFKKDVDWIQPATQKSPVAKMAIPWDQILETTKTIREASVSSWDDIDRLDVRPGKGVIKVRCRNRWEVQIDSSTGEILSSAYRRSDLIESLHDGSFFSDFVKRYVFSINGMVLLGLWLTGIWLWFLPINSRRKKRKRLAAKAEQKQNSGDG